MKLKPLFYGGIKVLHANIFDKYKMPLGVYIALTERCPNRCVYCNYEVLRKNKKYEITTGDVFNIIAQLKQAGTEKLHLSGGEPLIRDDLGKIIDYAKSKGMFVGISCSGIYIPEKVEMLKNVDVILLSLDGEEKIHDELRGRSSFKYVMDAMDVLKKNKITFWTNTVLTKKNLSSVDFILDLAEKNNTYANFILLQHHGPEYENNLPTFDKIKNLIPDKKDLQSVLKYLLLRKKQGKRVGSTKEYLEFLLNWDDYNMLYSDKTYNGIKCWAGRLFCHIDSQGLLYACGLNMGKISGIDIKSLGVKKAMEQAPRLKNCNSCSVSCNLENNLIFSLNLSSIFNWLKKL
ncbi:MAG: radical SAM protein [Candidatus Omnitrophica bacterium]|nr:radical SAM protein [Candidatus Omnitrophota bacterium]